MVPPEEFEELKEIVKAGCVLGVSIDKSLANGKFDWHDSRHFIDDIPHVVRAVEDFGIGLKAFPNISREQKEALHVVVKETLELGDAVTEEYVEDLILETFNAIKANYRLYSRIRAGRQG